MASEDKEIRDFEEYMQELRNHPIIGEHIKLGSIQGILGYQIPRMRYLSDKIGNRWVKRFYREFLTDLEETLNKNGYHLETKIKDLKYK